MLNHSEFRLWFLKAGTRVHNQLERLPLGTPEQHNTAEGLLIFTAPLLHATTCISIPMQ